MQVFELADELGVRSIDVVDACADVGLEGKDAGSELSDDEVKRVRFAFNQREAAAVMAEAAVAQTPQMPYPPATYPPPAPQQWHTPVPPSQRSKGMHPLIKKSIWYFVLGHVVPCVGIYFWVYSVILAGKGRQQVQWSGGRYEGDTAGLVIQILFWAELVLGVLFLILSFTLGSTTPQPQPR